MLEYRPDLSVWSSILCKLVSNNSHLKTRNKIISLLWYGYPVNSSTDRFPQTFKLLNDTKWQILDLQNKRKACLIRNPIQSIVFIYLINMNWYKPNWHVERVERIFQCKVPIKLINFSQQTFSSHLLWVSQKNKF